MRIGVNARFLIKNKLEGIGRFSWETLQLLAKNNPQHQFFFFFDRPFDASFIPSDNVTPIVLSPPARHPFLFYIWFEWMIPQALKKYKIDLFFTPDGFVSLRTKVKTVSVVHDLAFLHFDNHVGKLMQRYYTHFFPKFLRKADAIVTVSHFVKSDVLAHFPTIDAARIEVACNGIGADFHPLSTVEKDAVRSKYSSGKPYFFYLGAVQPRKNVEGLLLAFDLYKIKYPSDFQLLIGGRLAWKTASISKIMDQIKHREDIHFLGFLPETEIPQVLGAATALTYVSLFEGFGIPILEAFHAEVPVITSNISSMPEVAGDAAILVDPYQISSIAEAMHQLSSNEKLQLELIEKGRLRKENFSWQKATAAIEKAFRMVSIF